MGPGKQRRYIRHKNSFIHIAKEKENTRSNSKVVAGAQSQASPVTLTITYRRQRFAISHDVVDAILEKVFVEREPILKKQVLSKYGEVW